MGMQKKIFIILFFIIICLPSVAMFFYKTDLNAEKRQVQGFPELKKDGHINGDYFSELTDFFADNFAFRQELIEADGVIKSNVFKESNNDNVIVGKDGWLFFSETLDDYIGRNTLSERKIYSCAKVLSLIQENANNNNRKFLFIAAPDKNALYPEYMPSRYIKISDVNNYSLLKAEMEKLGVNTLDLQQMFKNVNKCVYHKLDTHWNNEGAAMACGWILDNLGKSHYDYSNEKYTIKKNFSGDLYGMLFPKGKKKDDNVIYEKKHTYEYLSKTNNVEDISLETKEDSKKGSIVMYRDSFGNALLPFVADEYNHGYFSKAVPYNLKLADDYNADAVVIEITERHIPSLIEEVPYMAAPLRTENLSVQTTDKCKSVIEMVDSEDEYLLFKGAVDKNYLSDNGNIYVRMYNDKNSYTFEAFPASYENEKADGYHFGLYIDTAEIASGSYDVEVISQKGNEYYTSGCGVEVELEE